MNNDSFFTPGIDHQFVLSHELVCLLKWLVENDTNKLKKIISGALRSGLKEELQKNNLIDDSSVLKNGHENIIDFFGIMEAILLDAMHEHTRKRALEKDLMPAIDQIDSTVCDDATVRFSVEKATSRIEKNPKENPKDLLFKELLRRWKPNKKNLPN